MTDQDKAIIFGMLKDKPVAYHPDIAKVLKSVTACVFLSQLLYWTGRGHNEWIYKTQAEWYEETGLTRKEQETARKTLIKERILHEQRRGQPARLYYKIDFDRFVECLSAYYSKIKNPDTNSPNKLKTEGESEQSSMSESGNLECPKGANKIAPKSHTIYTENTTENTTDIVVVEEPTVENCRMPNSPKSCTDHNNITKLQELAEKTSGAKIPLELLNKLVTEFGEGKVKEKLTMLGSVETENAPGFLVAALQDNYVLVPGRPQQHARAGPKTRSPDPVDGEVRRKKKEFIKSLYLS